jgi:metal-dependent amidase/aminoacylase/carboxypeptidase family protein
METNDLDELVKIRRALHQIPEIGLKEYETSKFVRNYLSQINNLHILDPIPGIETAVIAVLNV